VKLAVHYPNFSRPGGPPAIASTLAATARAADQGGVETFTVMDHWFQMENMGGPAEPMLEGYTTLGFLAGQTEQIGLGLLVTGVTYRHPGLLAKIVTTLDVLSGGRALLGIGAAWYGREHAGLGVPYPDTSERFERLEETLEICRQMWSGDDGPFEGKHYTLAETICIPQPLQAHVPILIGGSGEKKTLRLVAHYADATNLFAPDLATVAHKIDVLAGHCDTLGRDPATIEKTIIGGDDPLADPDGFLRRMEAFAAVGVDKVWVGPQSDDPAGWVSQLCETVLPRLRDL
jgi:F420-dependent oxidoreductase-like protein